MFDQPSTQFDSFVIPLCVCVRYYSEFSAVVPGARLAKSRFRAEENQENNFVRFVAGPGMGYGADIAPFLLHAEATAMRAVCVQMCYAIERVPAWPTPSVLTRLDLSRNKIGDAGAAALAARLQVRRCMCVYCARKCAATSAGQIIPSSYYNITLWCC
jgi:hypothetical protein